MNLQSPPEEGTGGEGGGAEPDAPAPERESTSLPPGTDHLAEYVAIGRDQRASGVSEDDLVAAASQPVPSAEYVAPKLILFDLSYDPEAGTSRLIIIRPQEPESERLEHDLIRAFHHWDDKPTRQRLRKLKAAVDALIDGSDD